MLQQLPTGSRTICNTLELQYRLAVCAFYLRAPAVAEEGLSSLVQQMPATDKQRRIVCDAKILLARVYLRVNKLDAARLSCDSAVSGRRRLLGKEHESYFESLALSSVIYSHLNNFARAEVVEMQIPERKRAAVLVSAWQLVMQDTDLDRNTVKATIPSPGNDAALARSREHLMPANTPPTLLTAFSPDERARARTDSSTPAVRVVRDQRPIDHGASTVRASPARRQKASRSRRAEAVITAGVPRSADGRARSPRLISASKAAPGTRFLIETTGCVTVNSDKRMSWSRTNLVENRSCDDALSVIGATTSSSTGPRSRGPAASISRSRDNSLIYSGGLHIDAKHRRVVLRPSPLISND